MTTDTKTPETVERVAETQKTKIGGLVGLLLLLAFFTPYVVKLPQLDITLILIGGMALAVIDFLNPNNR
jgi:hypothetical protein